MKKLLLILAGIIYALCPYDIVPDFFPGIGWLEDIALLGLLWWYLTHIRNTSQYYRYSYGQAGAHYYEKGEGKKESDFQGTRSDHSRGPKDPYEVLGIRKGASLDEIKRAYRTLASKYHPDKVSHLGDEFRELAEQRFKEIKEAYERLTTNR